MSRVAKIPGTRRRRKQALDIDHLLNCPYRSEHQLPNGGLIPTTFLAGRGNMPIDENTSQEDVGAALQGVTLVCMLGHEWTPSDGPVYHDNTTDKASQAAS